MARINQDKKLSLDIKQLRCGVCGKGDIRPIETVMQANPELQIQEIVFYCCSSCGSIFHRNLVFFVENVYKQSFYSNPLRMASLTKTVDFILKHIERGCEISALDIGCAGGSLMQLLESRGLEVCGFELSAEARAKLESIGFQVFDSMEDLSSRQFDLVVFSHVIEHVQEPAKFVDGFIPSLGPGGLLFIEVPSIELLADATTKSIFDNLYPNHEYHFSVNGLIDMMASKGFSALAIEHHRYMGYPSMMCMFRKSDVPENQTYLFRQHCQNENAALAAIVDHLETRAQEYSHLVIWGCSNDAFKILAKLAPDLAGKIVLIDSDPDKTGQELCSHQIRNPEYLDDLGDVLYFIAPTTDSVANSIFRSINGMTHGENNEVMFNRRAGAD